MESSLVSKAKTVLHSAAAKAEKVLTEIKADFKNDRGSEGLSQTATREIARGDNKFQADDTRSNSQGEGSERGLTNGEAYSKTSSFISIPTASVVKQLAMAVEAGRKFGSMKDLLSSGRDPSPVKESPGFVSSFSSVKSLMLREKEGKMNSEFVSDEEVSSLIRLLFDADDNFFSRNIDTAPSIAVFSRDIHGAPPGGFVVRLAEIIATMKTPHKMASFWFRVNAELRRLWYDGQPVPLLPMDEKPDLDTCLLHQQLQVINCCIARRRRRLIAIESLDSVMKESSPDTEDSVVTHGKYSLSPTLCARTRSGNIVLRLGADHPSENLIMLETGEPVYSPITQEGPIFTEDLIRETEEFVLRTGSVGAGCSQLLSDMQAFKAANPGCILEDFVRWHSPPDWTDGESNDITGNSFVGDGSHKGGQLSRRMQKEGNLWRELWETAKPMPAVRQTPIFDEDLAVESILNDLEDIQPLDIFLQLFVSVISSGFVIAETLVPVDSDSFILFKECKEYMMLTCQGEIASENIDNICQVYETVETMLCHPGKGLEMKQQSKIIGRLKKMGLGFVGKEKQFNRKTEPQNQRNKLDARLFSHLFPKKQQQPKPNEASVAAALSGDDNDWTIV